jgi:hypothetical protein
MYASWKGQGLVHCTNLKHENILVLWLPFKENLFDFECVWLPCLEKKEATWCDHIILKPHKRVVTWISFFLVLKYKKSQFFIHINNAAT